MNSEICMTVCSFIYCVHSVFRVGKRFGQVVLADLGPSRFSYRPLIPAADSGFGEHEATFVRLFIVATSITVLLMVDIYHSVL